MQLLSIPYPEFALLVDNAKASNTKGRELLDAAITKNAFIAIEDLINVGMVPTRVQYETYKKIIDDERKEIAKKSLGGFMLSGTAIEMMKDAVEKAERRSEALKNLSVFSSAHRLGIGIPPQIFPQEICLKIANMTGDLEDPVTAKESEKYFSKKF